MGKGSLRWASLDDLPPALRERAERALVGDVGAFGGFRPGKATAAAAVTAMLEAGEPVPVASNPGRPPTRRRPNAPKPADGTTRSKYGAVVTYVDGIRFDSKREAAYYEQLKLRVAAGEVLYFLRQVPIHLPGGTKLVIDFQEHHADGTVHYVDAKGRETPAFRIKQREVHHHFPFRIELV